MTSDTDIIENLRQRLSVSVKQRDELDKEVLHLKSALNALIERKGVSPELRRLVLLETGSADWKKPTLKRSIMEILRNSGSSLTCNQVIQRLKAAGLFDPGEYAQASSAVQTTLKRLHEDKKISRRGAVGNFVYTLPLPTRSTKK
jgi:hypothetical protein